MMKERAKLIPPVAMATLAVLLPSPFFDGVDGNCGGVEGGGDGGSGGGGGGFEKAGVDMEGKNTCMFWTFDG